MARENPPSNSLWFGNLPSDATDAEVKFLFEKHGLIDSITTYPSRNYGFVNFREIEAAASAKQALSGYWLRGSPLKIEFARQAKPCKSLWVSGISNSTSKEELEKEFQKFGHIQEFRFLRDRNTAYVDYFTLEDASQALKNMNGKRVDGSQLRVDFLRSHASRRDQSLDAWQFSNGLSDHYVDHGVPGFKRPFQFISMGSPAGEAQPSKVLRISHPPSVVIEEDMLHNALILFGEIERIKTFSDSNDTLVEFRSVEEARRAKEGLQGKLFNDPRIVIEFSNIGFPGSRGLPGENPFQSPQMGIVGHHQRGLLGNNPMRPSLPGIHGHDPYNPSSQNLAGGPNWRRSSPPLGVVSSPGAWDVLDSGNDHRESKRSRLDEHRGLHVRRGGGSPGLVTKGPVEFGKRHLESDFIWQGVIAKGGNLVCHARCVPLGQGLSADIPNVVNVSARTSLDLLTKHYDDAIGFEVVFFLPDSEKDFASYTEFLRYLGSKDRAGVAKFDDGTTLFLVPPSYFLTEVLKVSGPERLYGVVLKFPQATSSVAPVNPRSIHHEYPQPQRIPMPVGYTAAAPQEERVYPPDRRTILEAPLHPNTAAPMNSSSSASQPSLALTPELIATLTSLIPVSTGSQAALLPQATSFSSAPSNAAAPRSTNDAFQHHPSTQAIPTMPNAANQLHPPTNMYGQMHDRTSFPPQGVVSSVAPSMPLQIPPATYSHDGLRGPVINQGTVSSYPFPPLNQDIGAGISGTVPYMPQPSVVEHVHQIQAPPAASNGVEQESGDTEADKNERYQRTLLFAADLLSRIKDTTGNQSGNGGAGSR